MVAGAIAAIGILAVIIFFSKDIGKFLEGFKPLAGVADVGKAVEDAGKSAGEQFGSVVIRPINISILESKLEQEALAGGFKPSSGLTAKQQQELALDEGTFIIGGKQKEVQFGLIGDILPTDPSDFFIANAEKLLTPEQLERFKMQQAGTFGGQTSIGTNTIKVDGKIQVNPIDKTVGLFTDFGESFQKTITGGSLFSDLFK